MGQTRELQHGNRRFDTPAVFIGWIPALVGFAGLSLLLLCSGCSTVEMKGTPFYTGEYSRRQGPVEQRVNVWPLLYYREPALSVLWPVFEFTEDHAAVRPLFSVYGLDRTNRQYNLLWPLAQIDRQTEDSRLFPFFWGDAYCVLFPLYWHYGHPWGDKGGSDSLFPLWVLSRENTNRFNLYTPWPLVRVWADSKDDIRGSMVLPLYWQKREAGNSRFYSLPWMSSQDRNGDYWRLLLPLYYQARDGNSSTLITPVWQQGISPTKSWHAAFPLWILNQENAGGFDLFCPWPLVRFWAGENAGGGGSMVLPLYCYSRDGEGSRFLSLPWSSGANRDGSYWRLLPPLFYQASNETRSAFMTIPWSRGRSGTKEWQAITPLWVRQSDGTNRFDLHTPWPLAHFWSDQTADDHGSRVFPLYWHRRLAGESRFYSALWWSEAGSDGSFWRLLPPLYYHESDGTNATLVTPLWAQGCSATNDWRAIVPLCYWDRRQHTLLSPLWAHWWKQDAEIWLAPWLLSWKTRQPECSDLMLAGGLARASWGQKPGLNYVFPIYYHDPAQHTRLSPLWMHWREEDTGTTFVPWLLSWKTRQPQRSDLWLGAGLARASWGQKPGPDHVIPLYYHDGSHLFTPLFGRDKDAGYAYLATPLAGVWTGKRVGSWLFPLYRHARVKATDDVKGNYLLLGGYRKTGLTSRSWFIPLFHYRNNRPPFWDPKEGERSGVQGKSFWCLPICWYQHQRYLRPARTQAGAGETAAMPATATNPAPAVALADTNAPLVRDDNVSHGVFPLWSYSAHSTPAESRSNLKSSILLWLYNYEHSAGPPPGAKSGETHDYTRARILWRLWHYERADGDVSVDVFPSFTYDRKADGFKKVSFLWRFFRYQREADGGSKLDVLFIPLKR